MAERTLLQERTDALAEVRDALTECGYHPYGGMISGAMLAGQIRKMHADLVAKRERVRDLEAAVGRMALAREAADV